MVIRAKPEEVKLLARLIRAEAEAEGETGMLLVGGAAANRVLSDCLDFKDVHTIQRMVFQSPGGFESVHKPYFYQQARKQDIDLAQRVIKGERVALGKHALWFFNPDPKDCPPQWFNQPFSGKYKHHCFFQPLEKECPELFT